MPRFLCSWARECMKKFTARCWPGVLLRGDQLKNTVRNCHQRIGGNHIDAVGLDGNAGLNLFDWHPCVLGMISVNMLWWLGSRCWISTNAIPVSTGKRGEIPYTLPGRLRRLQ